MYKKSWTLTYRIRKVDYIAKDYLKTISKQITGNFTTNLQSYVKIQKPSRFGSINLSFVTTKEKTKPLVKNSIYRGGSTVTKKCLT